jgi:hypothetical protein
MHAAKVQLFNETGESKYQLRICDFQLLKRSDNADVMDFRRFLFIVDGYIELRRSSFPLHSCICERHSATPKAFNVDTPVQAQHSSGVEYNFSLPSP